MNAGAMLAGALLFFVVLLAIALGLAVLAGALGLGKRDPETIPPAEDDFEDCNCWSDGKPDPECPECGGRGVRRGTW